MSEYQSGDVAFINALKNALGLEPLIGKDKPSTAHLVERPMPSLEAFGHPKMHLYDEAYEARLALATFPVIRRNANAARPRIDKKKLRRCGGLRPKR